MQKESQQNRNGVYDISIEEYHNGDGISRSTLVEYLRSPFHYWYKANHKEVMVKPEVIKKTNALEFGNALHTFVLEPDEFHNRYAVFEKINRATKAGKGAYAQFLEQAFGKELICSEAYAEIIEMGKSIQSNELAREVISDAWYEKSIYWTDDETGLLCKVRPDIWHNNMIGDLKTTVSASYRDFQRSILSYGYHIQAGMIYEALRVVNKQVMNNFVYVAIEKEPPYALAVYQLDELALEQGVRVFKDILRGIRRCIDENNWPSYDSGLITLPTWAFR